MSSDTADVNRSVAIFLPDRAPIPLAASIVLGRDPLREPHMPVVLVDPTFSVSKNHATIERCDNATIIVTDLASTNGTAIRFHDSCVPLAAFEPTHVTIPCTIECGDCACHVALLG